MHRILPRSIAACRSFLRLTCAVAGGFRRPPHQDLLPHSVRGIFSNYRDHGRPYFFARPRGSGPMIDGTFSSIPDIPGGCWEWDTILDHCNGLILYEKDDVIPSNLYVCNPATRRWVFLPPAAHHHHTIHAGKYLVFDPTVSLDYKVFLIPDVPEKEGRNVEPLDLMEWPPLQHKLQVFSSSTQRWVEKGFVRESQPCGTVADVRLDPVEPILGPECRYAEYWRGALYVHCRGAYVMRLSLSDDKFQVIRTPTNIEENKRTATFLGRSEKGIHYAALKNYELRVWILDEKSEQTEWILKHHLNLTSLSRRMITLYREQMNMPWTLVDDNYSDCDTEQKVQDQDISEWDSDEDDVLIVEGNIDSRYCGGMDFLGFHPYKEVVFLSHGFTVVAYHLGSSKTQCLGCAWPKDYGGHCASFDESFVYTPCLIDPLPNCKL